MRFKFLDLGLTIAIIGVMITGFAQTWTQSSAGNARKLFVASSADGKVLMTINSGVPPLISTNSGATWATNASSPVGYLCAAISADGTTLVMPSEPGYIYLSTNTGNTWNQTMATQGYPWQSIACTPDGTKFFAGLESGPIWVSTNSGATWQTSNSGNADWVSIGTSADGTKIAASANNQIYVSTNAGSNWRPTTVRGNSVATTPDGGVLAVTGNGSTYISKDFGNTWCTNAVNGTSGGGTTGNSIALSADGRYMAVTGINSPIYTSTNSGATWVTNNAPSDWYGIASSADGYRLVAVSASGQGIWLGQYTPSPPLKFAPSGGKAGFSWTISTTNFVLQQSLDLNNWSTVTNAPVLNLTNLQNQVTLSMSPSNAFFRLKTP